jgi:phosphoserine aminotransferase
MERKINFNAGPAELPGEVLHEISRATQKYKKTGLSILETSHRSDEFIEILEESKHLVRELCGLDDNYEIIWTHGGARMQFTMVPMNLLGAGQEAAYIDSGHWAHEAAAYGRYYGNTKIIASSAGDKYNSLPTWPEIAPGSHAYVHLTTNNTVYGTQWQNIPTSAVPLIADMSSDILSGPQDYSRFAVVYAAAQKNLGIAGVALAAIRKDMLQKSASDLAPILSYKSHVAENSLVNTTNVFGVFSALLMLRWIKQKGMDAITRDNLAKSELLYRTLDSSKVFTANVTNPAHRSKMNVCFSVATKEQETAFLSLCERNHIVGIKGHRIAGGFRASLYNAISIDAVASLVAVMQEFEAAQ